jgi:hypothetical protein
MAQKKLVTFLDNAQRTVIGEDVSALETPSILSINNPVVVNIVQQYDQTTGKPNGMGLQLLPLFFKEFLGDKAADTVYNYNRDTITAITFEGGFDFRLYMQYDQIFATPVATQPEVKPEGKVINLFPEET